MVSTLFRYPIPVDVTRWTVAGQTETTVSWDYEDGRAKLLSLYEKGKQQQWDASRRIDWSVEIDPENPQQLDDRMMPLAGSPLWARLSPQERAQARLHQQAHTLSQFLHGEQAGMMAVCRLVCMLPDLDAKFYAATQVIDEARHTEVYGRLLREKFKIVYPMSPGLTAMYQHLLQETRWDIVCLGIQVLLEGVALAVFQRIRDYAQNPLAAAINAYVMQDEARHVAFGRLVLRDLYPQLTEAERGEREEYIIESCYHIRDRLDQSELWRHLGFSQQESREAVMASESTQAFRAGLFSRIIPTIKDIGLWGPKVQRAFAALGALPYESASLDEISARDTEIAERLDAERFVKEALRSRREGGRGSEGGQGGEGDGGGEGG